MRDAHLQIVHHIHEMKDRLAIRSDDHEIRVLFLAVGELALHITNDHVRNGNWFPGHLEFHRAFRLISETAGEKRFDPALVKLAALALKVRTALPLAGPGGVGIDRAFIPFEAKPAQSVENHIHRLLRIAGHVGILDAQDECAARMARIEPVKQGGARSSNVEEPRGAWSKTNPNFHGIIPKFLLVRSPDPGTITALGGTLKAFFQSAHVVLQAEIIASARDLGRHSCRVSKG